MCLIRRMQFYKLMFVTMSFLNKLYIIIIIILLCYSNHVQHPTGYNSSSGITMDYLKDTHKPVLSQGHLTHQLIGNVNCNIQGNIGLTQHGSQGLGMRPLPIQHQFIIRKLTIWKREEFTSHIILPLTNLCLTDSGVVATIHDTIHDTVISPL